MPISFDHYPFLTITPPPTRYVTFGDAMICTVCRLDSRYCRGHANTSAVVSNDESRAARSLAARIKDHQASR